MASDVVKRTYMEDNMSPNIVLTTDTSPSRCGTPPPLGASPAPPEVLSAAAHRSTRSDLAWTAPANEGLSAISGYRIEWSADRSSAGCNAGGCGRPAEPVAPVRSPCVQASVQVEQSLFQSFAVLVPRDAVDARRSVRSTYSHRANSRTSILLSDAMALKSKLSRLLTAGNLACLIRRSTMRRSRSISSNSVRRTRYRTWSAPSVAHWRASLSYSRRNVGSFRVLR